MKGFLLDTNVLSELRRPRPHPSVVQFVSTQTDEVLHVSTVTFAEIRFGIERTPDPARRSELSNWLDRVLKPGFGDRRLAVSEDILLRWRLTHDALRRRGRPTPFPDLLIAATAEHHDLVVVSRDAQPFLDAGTAVLDPWNGVAAARRQGAQEVAPWTPVDVTAPDLLDRLGDRGA